MLDTLASDVVTSATITISGRGEDARLNNDRSRRAIIFDCTSRSVSDVCPYVDDHREIWLELS